MSVTSKASGMKSKLIAGAAALAIVAGAGMGASALTGTPVFAEAVRVDGPAVASFADIVEKVTPAVVSVRVSATYEPVRQSGRGYFFNMPGFDDLPDDHPLKRFFRDFRGEQPQPEGRRRGPRGERPISQGSGFFISSDGYLVTNNHVVEGGSAYTIVTDDGTEFEAKLVGTDPRTDLAVLKVDSDTKFTYVEFADDGKTRVGDWVVAVGNPFGLGGTVTAGIVSARGRDIGAGPYDDFIQIDAAVNRGNSGGPAFNLNGEVVGVNTAIYSPSGGNVGIAFAIPASTASDVVKKLIEDGKVERGWLGVQIQPVTRDIAESLGLSNTNGALVSDTPGDGPAKSAGIAAGDVILSVNGETVASPRELARMIGNIAPGTEVEIGLWSGSKAKQVKVKLGAIPDEPNNAGPAAPERGGGQQSGSEIEEFGLTLAPSENGEGLVVTQVDDDSEAAARGIRAGDVIVTVNAEPVKSVADVKARIEAASKAGRKAVMLQVQRDGANRFVALPVMQG